MMEIYNEFFFVQENHSSQKIILPDSEQDLHQQDYEEIQNRELEIDNDFDPNNLDDDRKRRQVEVVQREGQEKFRSELLQVYSGMCVVTQCNVPAVLEAAHIIKYSGVDSNHIQNGLLLRKDIHTLFDRKLLTIDADSMRIMISPELLGSCYESLNDKKVYLPKDTQYQPNLDSLKRHNYDFMSKHYNHLIEKFRE